MKRSDLSQKDIKILRQLKKNARSTIRQISKRTGIRPSTVHQRLSKMIDNGTIERFTIDVDQKRLGYEFTVFMLISGSLDMYLDKEIIKNKNIVGLYGVTGEYDLLMTLKFKDMDEFNMFIIDFRARYSDSIHKTVTMVQTIELKSDDVPI